MLTGLQGDLAGNYHHLNKLTDDEKDYVSSPGINFVKGDALHEVLNLNKDWPNGRGVFVTNDKAIVAKVN